MNYEMVSKARPSGMCVIKLPLKNLLNIYFQDLWKKDINFVVNA